MPLTKQQQELIDKMVAYIDASCCGKYNEFNIRPGIAIAGPQVGLMYRVIYVHWLFNDKEYKYLLANPTIVSESQTNCYLSTGEGCLSVKENVQGYIKRKNQIVVTAINLLDNNNIITINVDGYLAICLQHEIDHLDGILYYDRINKSDPFHKEDD